MNLHLLDYATAEHFYTWLENHVPDDEQRSVEQGILALVTGDPTLVNDHSWPELRAMAERNGRDW